MEPRGFVEAIFGFFVVLGLLLCPLVLLLLVSILIATLIATCTFLRNLQKPPTQIIATDTHMKVILEDPALETKPGLGDEESIEGEGDSGESGNSRQGVDTIACHATEGHEIDTGGKIGPGDEERSVEDPGCGEETDSDERNTSHQNAERIIETLTGMRCLEAHLGSEAYQPDGHDACQRHQDLDMVVEHSTKKLEAEPDSEANHTDGHDIFHQHQDADVTLEVATLETKPGRSDEQSDADERDTSHKYVFRSIDFSAWKREAEPFLHERNDSNDRDTFHQDVKDVDTNTDHHSKELEAGPGDGLVWEDYYTFDEEVSASIDRASANFETGSNSELFDSDDRDAFHQGADMSVDDCSRELEAEAEDGRSGWEGFEASDEGTNGISDCASPGPTIHTSQDVLELLRDVAISAPSPLPPFVISREPWPFHSSTLEGTLRHPRVKLPSEPNTSSAPSPLPPIVVSREPWPSHLSTLEDTLLDSRRPRVKLPSGLNTKPGNEESKPEEEVELELEQDNEGSDSEVGALQVPDIQTHARNTFLGLPAELRLIVYEFALQDHIDSIYSTPPSPISRPFSEIVKAREELRPPPFLSGLALNHTNRIIRNGSLDLFECLLHAHFRAAVANIHGLSGVRKAASDDGDDDRARIILQAEHDAVFIMFAVHQLGSRTRFCTHKDYLRRRAARLSTGREG
jgi:hypothetical protein